MAVFRCGLTERAAQTDTWRHSHFSKTLAAEITAGFLHFKSNFFLSEPPPPPPPPSSPHITTNRLRSLTPLSSYVLDSIVIRLTRGCVRLLKPLDMVICGLL